MIWPAEVYHPHEGFRFMASFDGDSFYLLRRGEWVGNMADATPLPTNEKLIQLNRGLLQLVDGSRPDLYARLCQEQSRLTQEERLNFRATLIKWNAIFTLGNNIEMVNTFRIFWKFPLLPAGMISFLPLEPADICRIVNAGLNENLDR